MGETVRIENVRNAGFAASDEFTGGCGSRIRNRRYENMNLRYLTPPPLRRYYETFLEGKARIDGGRSNSNSGTVAPLRGASWVR